MKIAPPYWGGHYTQFRGWGEAGALNGCVGGAIRGRRATRHNEVRGFRRFVLFSLQHITSSLQRAPFPEFDFDFTYLFSISASNTVV